MISWTTQAAIGCLFLCLSRLLASLCEYQFTGNLTARCLDPGRSQEIVDPILIYDDEDLFDDALVLPLFADSGSRGVLRPGESGSGRTIRRLAVPYQNRTTRNLGLTHAPIHIRNRTIFQLSSGCLSTTYKALLVLGSPASSLEFLLI